MKLADFLLESGGESAGTKEVTQTSLKKARKYFEKTAEKMSVDLDTQIDNFDKNFKRLKKSVKNHGEMDRSHMPVVSWKQVKDFQRALTNGDLNIQNPSLNESVLMELKIDGTKEKVNATFKSIRVKDLKPVQSQVYLSKVSRNFKKYGIPDNNNFIISKYLIIDKNNRIIDGHHRWATVMLANPDLKIDLLKVDLDMEKLLPLTKSYGVSRGNKQNS